MTCEPHARGRTGGGESAGPTLLVVDDRTENLTVLAAVLRDAFPNGEVLTASSGEEGLRIVSERAVSAALIDVQMPGIDGIEMIERLKADENTARLPTLLMTAHSAEARTRANGLDVGADDFVARPIDNVELVARVRVLLRVGAAEAELRHANRRLSSLADVRAHERDLTEQKYRELIESLNDAVFIIDAASDLIIEINPKAEDLLGRARRDLVGTHLSELAVDGEGGFGVAPKDGNAEPTHWDAEIMRPDGTAVPVTVTRSTLSFGDDGICLVLLHDITARKRNEMALSSALRDARRLQEQESLVLRAARAVLEKGTFADIAATIFEACKHAIEVDAGYVERQDFDGTRNQVLLLDSGPAAILADPELPEPIRDLRQWAYDSGQAVFLNDAAASESAEALPDGQVSLAAVLFAPLVMNGQSVGMIGLVNKLGGFTDEDARIAGMFANLAAIALSKSVAAEALAASEARHRAVVESAADGMVTINSTGKIAAWNPAAELLFGWPAAEAIGQPVTIVIPESLREAHDEHFRRSEQGVDLPAAAGSSERIALNRNGVEFPVEVTVSTWSSKGDRFYTGVIRDITERREMAAKLAQSDRLASVGMLAAGVAHEINNPLAYIMSNLEYLAAELPNVSSSVIGDISEAVNDCLEGARRVRRIVRDLMTFSRGRDNVRARVDVNELVANALQMAQHEIRFRARVSHDFGELPPVLGDAGPLCQVFLNLLINAAQAIPEGRVDQNTITVATWSKNGEVCVSIEDTGEGISPENIDRLFDAFFTTKAVGFGTGLGLSTCLNTVTAHGGLIDVRSEVGKGSRFEVRIPVGCSDQAAEEAPGRPGESSTKSVKPAYVPRVLIVDDEARILSAATRLLRRRCDLLTAASGAEAKQLLNDEGPFDLVLCDLIMPDFTGMDLYDWMERRDAPMARRIVFMTGGAFTERSIEFVRSKQITLLEKPLAGDELLRLVATAARRS